MPRKWLYATLKLSSLISYTFFDFALELANAPTPSESTWLRRVRSLPAKGTWVAPNIAKTQNIKEWIMDSNTADIIIFWIHGRDHTIHAVAHRIINANF
jgi:hypothetical protein